MSKNFVFISPTFPDNYYQFPQKWKECGGVSLCVGEDNYDTLKPELKAACDEYYQVDSMHNYDAMYRAVAWFAHKHGKIDWLESNNEYWLEQDAKLRTDFNITTGEKEEDVYRFRKKSNMKAFYKKAGATVARHHLVTTYEEGKKFVDTVGYPVIVKPDNGMGANGTWKIKNESDLKDFYDITLDTQYIMEEYVDGYIVSFDGIVDQQGNIIYKTSHVFPNPIMDIVNNAEECMYYSEREIPKDLDEIGTNVIKKFNIKGRFFHTEYFRLNKEKEGLGKKGDLVALEVNMRPPGGYSPDMMNYSDDIDVYRLFAEMAMGTATPILRNKKYHCVYVGRRNGQTYKNNEEKILKKYKKHLVMQGEMADALSTALGNTYYIARFESLDDVNAFIQYTLVKKAGKK